MDIYVLIIKADNTGKIGIYRFFEGNNDVVMGWRRGVAWQPLTRETEEHKDIRT